MDATAVFGVDRRHDDRPPRPWSRWLEAIGRIPNGRTVEQATAAFDVDARRAMALLPGADRALGTNWRGRLAPLSQARSDRRLVRAAVLLLGPASMVLACLNLASLQLLEIANRGRELAIRAALGATSRNAAFVRINPRGDLGHRRGRRG